MGGVQGAAQGKHMNARGGGGLKTAQGAAPCLGEQHQPAYVVLARVASALEAVHRDNVDASLSINTYMGILRG